MKNIVLILCALLISCNSNKESTNSINSKSTKTLHENLVASEAEIDFRNQLKKITSKQEFESIDIVFTIDSKKVSEQIKELLGNSTQAFYIASNKNKILIYANTIDDLEMGMYWYLAELGFRWYFPGKLWEHVPEKTNYFKIFHQIVKPDFSNRSFFGGGGLIGNHPGDKKGYAKTEWLKWQKRNLFGEQVDSKGHVWQDIIRRNLDEFHRHPEYLAKPLDKVKPVLKTKFCVSNKGLVDLVIKDRRKKLLETIKEFGIKNVKSRSVGIEPSDGSGHCECEECQKIGTVSNRVFYLANKVAIALEGEFPDVKVTLLAYSEHSAVPSIDIHKNIFVTIVPYLFQHETMAEEFIGQWKSKVDNLQVYDYWGLVISRRGKPMKGFMKNVNSRFKMLNYYKVDKYRVESTYSIGAVGIPLYLMGRLSFNSSRKHDLELQELLTNCFGGVKPIMENMFNRWSEFDFLPAIERLIVFEELSEAKRKAESKEIRSRIEAFEKYIHFLLYADKLERNKKNKVEMTKNLDNLIDYSWAILPDLMIHSAWISSPFMRTYDRKRYDDKYRKKERNRRLSYWTSLKVIPFKESNATEASVRNSNKNFKVISKKSGNFEKTLILQQRANSVARVEFKTNQSFSFKFVNKKRQNVEFILNSKIINPKRKGSAFIIGLYDESDKLLWSKTYKGASNNIPGKIDFPSNGTYTIKVKMPNLRSELEWNNVQNTFLECGTKVNVGEYYYKTNQKEIFLYSQSAIKVTGKNNKNLLTALGDNIYSVNSEDTDYIKIRSTSIAKVLNSENCTFFLN